MTLWLPVTESLLPPKSCETSTETAKWVRWPGPLGIVTPQPFLDDYSISFPSKIGIAMLDCDVRFPEGQVAQTCWHPHAAGLTLPGADAAKGDDEDR